MRGAGVVTELVREPYRTGVRIVEVVVGAEFGLRVIVCFAEVAEYEAIGAEVVRGEGFNAIELGHFQPQYAELPDERGEHAYVYRRV